MVLKSVGVLSAGKLCGAMGVLVGLLLGGFMALFALAGAALQPPAGANNPQLPAIFVGVGAIIFVPIFYGVFAFVTGIIYAVLYNLIAGVIGGLELEFERPTPP
jgi:hypothetical protein